MIKIAPALYWELLARARDVELKRMALAEATAALQASVAQRNDVTKRAQKRHRKLDLIKKDYRWDDETTTLTEVGER